MRRPAGDGQMMAGPGGAVDPNAGFGAGNGFAPAQTSFQQPQPQGLNQPVDYQQASQGLNQPAEFQSVAQQPVAQAAQQPMAQQPIAQQQGYQNFAQQPVVQQQEYQHFAQQPVAQPVAPQGYYQPQDLGFHMGQEPAAKRFKGCGDGGARPGGKGGPPRTTGDPLEEGEVRYVSAEAARRAVELFHQSPFNGSMISVALDPSCADGTKIIVTGMPAGLAWQELKDHFQQVGEVHFANVQRSMDGAGKGYGKAEPGRPCVGEVRYTTKEDADKAKNMFNGTFFKGNTISVRPDLSSFNGTKLMVFNIPIGTDWTELREQFVQAGQIAFCGIDASLKGKGKMGKGMQMQAFGAPGFRPPPAHSPMPACGGGWMSHMGPGQQMQQSPVQHMGTDFGAFGGASNSASMPALPDLAGNSYGSLGEVRFDCASTAQQAIALLNGSTFKDSTLSVVQDGGCRDGSRILVFGVPLDADRQELKMHFEQAGRVEFCGWKGKGNKGCGKDKGAPGEELVGEVRFELAAHAEQAAFQLNGSMLAGAPISLERDMTCRDGTRVLARGAPPGTHWTALRDLMAQIGTVAFASFRPLSQVAGGGFAASQMQPAAHGFAGAFAAPGGKGSAMHGTNVPMQAAPLPPPPADSGAVGAPLVGEVIYNNQSQAAQAVQTLNGSLLRNVNISVQFDASAMGGGTVTVYNLPPDCTNEELQAHFGSAVPGPAPMAVVHRGPAAQGGCAS